MKFGLKHYKRLLPRRRVLGNIRNLFETIQHAWQRAWYGYDDESLWYMSDYLDAYLYEAIKYYRYEAITVPYFDNDLNKSIEIWHGILDDLLDHLEFLSVDALEVCYNECDDPHYLDIHYFEESQNAARREIYRILSRYINCFWD